MLNPVSTCGVYPPEELCITLSSPVSFPCDPHFYSSRETSAAPHTPEAWAGGRVRTGAGLRQEMGEEEEEEEEEGGQVRPKTAGFAPPG